MKSQRIAAAVLMSFFIAGVVYWINFPEPVKISRSVEAPAASGRVFQEAGPDAPQAASVPKNVESPVRSEDVGVATPTQRRKLETMNANAATMLMNRKTGRTVADKAASPHVSSDDELETSEPASAGQPVGIRLAHDVRLPAAALPVDFKMSPVAEKMLKEIVDDYYRELAADVDPAQVDNGTEAEGEGPTVVVPNGSKADAARQRADYRFRALFGNAAYNRMTMYSVLESHLPIAQTPADGSTGE